MLGNSKIIFIYLRDQHRAVQTGAFYSGNIRWVSSGELKPKYLCETSQHISSEAVSSCNLREYPANTLLIAMYGLEAAGVRGTASILSVPATISQACMAIQQTGGNRH